MPGRRASFAHISYQINDRFSGSLEAQILLDAEEHATIKLGVSIDF